MRISGLFVYPLKSGAAMAVDSWDLDDRGLVGDREYMVVDAVGQFLTQREAPLLARVVLDATVVKTPLGQAHISPALQTQVSVWGYTGPAVDCGDGPAEVLTALLGRPCRLVRTSGDHARRSDDGRSAIGFADGFPLLLTTEASLVALNSRLPVPLPMNRFRPNVVVSGTEAFEEDTWRDIELSGVAAQVVKPCARCAITRVDQATGIRGDGEPLRTLGTFRKAKGGVMFGQNVVHASAGTLRVGDEVRVLSRQAPPALRP